MNVKAQMPKLIRIIGAVIFFYSIMTCANSAAAENRPLSVVVTKEPLASVNRESYVGAGKCSTCHKKQYKKWQMTRHAKSLLTLKKDNQLFESKCLRCHTTGYGEQDGFSDLTETSHLAGVQCEACHGRGSRHIADVNVSGWDKIGDCVNCQIRKVCMVCHTPQHSPDFDFEEYLNKISCRGKIR